MPPVARDYRTTDDRPADVLLDLLVDRLEDYKATVLRCAPDEVAATVATALGATVAGRRRRRPGGAGAAGARTARPRTTAAPPWRWPTSPPTLTGVAVAIAETGTLVLDGSPLSGRRALSLLPDCLVCVVEADQVVGSVPEGLAVLDPIAPLTMISGPSATSDIELSRVEGVHGPRTLIVVLVG